MANGDRLPASCRHQRRLFELPPETPVEIEVAIDRPAPFRVKHKGLIVTVASNSLVIETELATPTELARAAGLAQRALQTLPETPVVAVGLNLMYVISEKTAPVASMLESSLDDVVAVRMTPGKSRPIADPKTR